MLEDSYLESYYEKFYVQKNDFFQNIRYGVSFARDVALRRYLQPSEESRWADALLGPTVKYEPTANRIVVPLTLLQPPFFQSDYPK
jgi:predicted metalloendopeptidase